LVGTSDLGILWTDDTARRKKVPEAGVGDNAEEIALWQWKRELFKSGLTSLLEGYYQSHRDSIMSEFMTRYDLIDRENGAKVRQDRFEQAQYDSQYKAYWKAKDCAEDRLASDFRSALWDAIQVAFALRSGRTGGTPPAPQRMAFVGAPPYMPKPAAKPNGNPRGRASDAPAAPNAFRGPAQRHRLTKVDQGTVAKDLNTVFEPGVDVAADVAAINQGLAQRAGDKFIVNGRTYGIEPHGTLYPVSGPGFHPLDRGGFRALGVLNEFGDTPRAAEIMQLRGLTPEAIEAGRAAWKAGQK